MSISLLNDGQECKAEHNRSKKIPMTFAARRRLMDQVKQMENELEQQIERKEMKHTQRRRRRRTSSLQEYMFKLGEEMDFREEKLEAESKSGKVKDQIDIVIRKRRDSLKHRLLASVAFAEKNVNDAVEIDWRRVEENLQRNQHYLNASVGKEVVIMEIHEMCDEAQKWYLNEMRSRKIVLGYSHILLRNAKIVTKSKVPPWVARLADMVVLLDHFGHSPHTKWRSRIVGECKELSSFIRETFTDQITLPIEGKACAPTTECDRIVNSLEELFVDINLYSARQLISRIHGLILLAENIEHEWGEAARFERKVEESVHQTVEESRAAIQTVSSNIRSKKDTKFREIGSVAKVPQPFTRKNQPRTASHFGMEVCSPPTQGFRANQPWYLVADDIIFTLDKIDRIPIYQHNESQVQKRYIDLLRDCAKHGLWHVAFVVYNSMYARIPHKVTLEIFKILIACCKRACQGNSFQALKVAEEMFRRGFDPSLQIFNLLIDACVPLGEWRLASKILLMMTKCGVGASTATYDTLDRVCQNTANKHAADVYEVLKLSGVPETIAFGCAQSCTS